MDPSEFRRRKAGANGGRQDACPTEDSLEDASCASSLQRARAESPPERAAITHGVYLRDGACMICDECKVAEVCEQYAPGERCAIEVAWITRRRPQICQALVESGHDPELHQSLVDIAIFAEIRVGRAARFVAARGEFHYSRTEGDSYSGVAKQIPALQAAAIRALEALNLTPAAMAKLRAQQEAHGPVSELGMAVHRAGALEEAVTDAEFEEEEGDDSGG